MENDIHLKSYWEVVRRRKLFFIIPCIVIFSAITTIVLLLPLIYKATATIAIESHAVSQNLVHSGASGYIEERLVTTRKRALNYRNLLMTVERFGLYAELAGENSSDRFVEEMRKNILIEPATTEVVSERSGRPMRVTTGFTVSFEGREPEKLADVANYLASLFLEANTREREKRANTTIQFLAKQLESLKSEIQATESQLAEFKEKHLNQLPGLMQLNLKTMDQLERAIDSQEQQIESLINRKIYMEGQLALLEPTMHTVTVDGKKILTPKEELALLRSQYLTLSASLSQNHPDVIKLKKKVEALEGEVGTHTQLQQLQRDLYDKEHQLALLQKRLSQEHPDVVKLKKEVMLLREQLQRLSEKQKVLKEIDEKPENPAYITLQTRIKGTLMEIEAARKKLEKFHASYEEYRERVESSPKVEQLYLDLQRNYTNAQANYEETSKRLRVAREAGGLEEDRMAEKFSLVQPATTPLEPYKPNRPALILLGFLLAVSSGIGVGSISEYMDHSVHTADELAEIAGHKVLTVIPYWETSEDLTKKRRRLWAFVGSTIAIAVIGVAAVNFLYRH